MTRAWKFRAVVGLAVVGLLLTALAPTASTATEHRGRAAFSSSPSKNYVGGQALRFSGNIGASGVRRIHLQQNFGRAGDTWSDIDEFSAQTKPNGDFSFVYPAPAAFGIRLRVVAAGGLATPQIVFEAASQDLTVTPVGNPFRGRPFVLTVDTTPNDLARRPDLLDLLPIPGREVTLQERVSPTKWRTLDTNKTTLLGLALFTRTEQDAGTHVYRAVQEDWTKGRDEIGWFPSFPTYVDVDGAGARTLAGGNDAGATTTTTAPSSGSALGATFGEASTTAGARFGWGPFLFDFAWEYGESLTSKPYRGTKRQGRWLDYSDGTGRASHYNGGLTLDSKRDNRPGRGDVGTTKATMRGNPLRYGRWETRLRVRSDEAGSRDYLSRAMLVPEATGSECGTKAITIGEFKAHGTQLVVGARSGRKAWGTSVRIGKLQDRPLALAVEVTRKHVTWFVEGKPIATAPKAAVPDVPMTLQVALVGRGRQEMNHTRLMSDWQRGWAINRAKPVTAGRMLKAGKARGGC